MIRKDTGSGRPFAKRSLGQNFLSDHNYIKKIVDAINPSPADTIIEIGPGRGALTELLVATGARIIAVELDRDLIPLLNSKFVQSPNFCLIEKDALTINFSSLANERNKAMKLVANLPYYISTAILQRLIDQRDVFSEMVLMFQREVVERMIAKPGNPERGFLSVLVEAYLNVKPLFDVPPVAFRPVPKVWSTVASLKPSSASAPSDAAFKDLISHAFRQPRKTIFNNLRDVHPHVRDLLIQSNVDPNLRPEQLSPQQWQSVSISLQRAKRENGPNIQTET